MANDNQNNENPRDKLWNEYCALTDVIEKGHWIIQQFGGLGDQPRWFLARQAQSYGTKLSEPQRRFQSRAEHREVPPPRWLIHDLIGENSDAALYAPFGFLKTFLAVDLAFSVATGQPALGKFDVEPGPAIYWAGEGYHNMVKKRAVAWELSHHYEPYSSPNIWIANGVPLTSNEDMVEADVAEIEELLAGRKANLFVVDTMNRALNGQDEDKAHVASKYLHTVKRIRERIGGSSLTVAHMGKDLERGERGSSGFGAGFDTILWVRKCQKDEDTGVHTIELFVRKQKDAEDGQSYWFQSERVMTEHGESLVLMPITDNDALTVFVSAKPGKGLTPAEVADALRVQTAGGGWLGTTKLARHIAEMTGRKQNSVEQALTRNRDKGKKFNAYVLGEPGDGKWCLPGRHMKGMGETLQDQINDIMNDQMNGVERGGIH